MGAAMEFLRMGGHAAFIWPAYGIVAIVLAGLFVAGRRFERGSAAELAALNPRARRQGQTTDAQSKDVKDAKDET